MRYLVLPAAVLLTASLAVDPAHSQNVIRGKVVDDSDHATVSGVNVTLLSDRGTRIRTTTTNELGEFLFSTRTSGFVRLSASRIGYQPVTSPRFELERRDTMDVELRLLVDAVLLTPLEVVARSRLRRSATLDGFYSRLRSGLGHYLTREDIEFRSPFYLSDVLATIPGVRLTASRPGGGRSVYMSRALPRATGCPVQVFLDGVLMSHRILQPTGMGADRTAPSGSTSLIEDGGFTIDELVSPNAVEGIEVYKGLSSVPAEFLNRDAACGVIAIWTRRGGPRN